ncbi:nuclease-related domain-containing protein [Mesobacillus subterraneus]|uniref:nuclease-related domain-containing protein n=1 Tax=Mesobacillus subterraneus TaxID=285983 RepID=UPI001FE91B58|nr:nuclease-related domain-containing protein [Mesobacillus subterraneus]
MNLLHETDFHIFQSIRLPYGKNFFQIDFLLLSPKFILLIEAKNMPGIIEFEPVLGQVIRTYNEKVETYEDPLLQVKRQREQLRRWLQDHHFPSIPIEFIAAYSNSATTLRNSTSDREVYERVCKAGKLVFKIEEYKQKYSHNFLTDKEFKKISKQILKSHIPEGSHLHLFNIGRSDILPGVSCPSCHHIPMKRVSANWLCTSCGATSKDAHHQAVADYFLLVSPTISTKQFKEFLFFPTRKMAADAIGKMGLKPIGGKRNRVYIRPESTI